MKTCLHLKQLGSAAALTLFLIPFLIVAAAGQHAAAPQPLTLPAIRPGVTVAQVEALIGQPEFEGTGEHNLRSLNWHQTPMMIMVLVDDKGVVASVMFQLKKGRRFVTDDGVIVGRDTLRAAAAKIGDRVIKRSEIGYVVDASCFGASITTKSKASDWVVTYESLECDEGEQSVEKLPRSPVNNVTIAAKSLSQ